MKKPTPNPPETDPASPYESLDSKKLHEAAERALDHYLNPAAQIMASNHEPEPMFLANPKWHRIPAGQRQRITGLGDHDAE
jgi:hypothetical protein